MVCDTWHFVNFPSVPSTKTNYLNGFYLSSKTVSLILIISWSELNVSYWTKMWSFKISSEKTSTLDGPPIQGIELLLRKWWSFNFQKDSQVRESCCINRVWLACWVLPFKYSKFPSSISPLALFTISLNQFL